MVKIEKRRVDVLKKIFRGIFSTALLASCLLPSLAFGSDSLNNWQKQIPVYKEPKVTVVQDGPVLLFSDSPEMVKNCGVMYRDTVSGKVRVFFHHVNDTQSNKRLAVVLRNRGIHPVDVTVGRKGVSKPNPNWLDAGKKAQIDYFSSSKEDKFTIGLRGKHEFLTNEKGVEFKPQEIITGIVDFQFSHPVEISFMMIPVGTDFDSAVDAYDVLPPDNGKYVLRGTFKNVDYHITFADTFDSRGKDIWGITLADNKKNPYVKGIDATTGKPSINYGNYGVVYDLSYRTNGPGKTVFRFNPWGGTFAGSCLLQLGDKTTNISLPSGRLYFGDKVPTESMILGEAKGKTAGKIFFSPPGASNLPVRIFMEPVKKAE
jgi:hypothetical protein